MGHEGGGVPGHGGVDLPFVRTTVNAHPGESQRSDASCEPVAGIDEDCVDRALEPGTYTGRWVPGTNDCQMFVVRTLQACTTEGVADESEPIGGHPNE